MPRAKARDHTVKVLVKSFEILETLSRAGENGARLTEVATVRKLPAPTVFRILRTLVKIGYVAFNERSERYCIAEPLKSLGQNSVLDAVTRLSRPVMMRLLAEFEQTVNLALFERGRLAHKSMLEGLRSIRMQSIPGEYISMVHSALGKSILAFLPRSEVLEVIQAENELGRNSYTRPAALMRELERIREIGRAIDDEEVEKGLRCVGAPIFDKDGAPIASISISGSTAILTDRQVSVMGKRLVQACDEVSMALGYLPRLRRKVV